MAPLPHHTLSENEREILKEQADAGEAAAQTEQVTILDLGSRYGTAKLVTDMKKIPEGVLLESSSYWV